MKLTKQFLVLFGLLVIVLSACQPVIPTEVPDETEPADKEYIYGEDAMVESLEIMLLESFPVQVKVIVKGNFPDGCTELDEISVERDEQEFTLTISTRKPAGDVMCTEALVPFEETVDLEVAGLKAGTYTVIAQDQETTFTLDVDNELGQDGGEMDFVLGSDAVLESMSLSIMESFPVQVGVMLTGYMPDGCTELEEIRVAREDQTFNIEIITRRPAGDVACTMAIVPFEEYVQLDVEGLPAGEYVVACGLMKQTFTLDVDNKIED